MAHWIFKVTGGTAVVIFITFYILIIPSLQLLWKTKPLKKLKPTCVFLSSPLLLHLCVPCRLTSGLYQVPSEVSAWTGVSVQQSCGRERWGRLKLENKIEMNQNWENELRTTVLKHRVEMSQGGVFFVCFLRESLTLSLMVLRRLPCGVVWEELRPALVVRNHGWKIHSGTQLHLHQRMLRHTPVQRSCNTCYPLLDWHINHTSYFILSLVNKQILKQCGREIGWHTVLV